MAGTYELKSTSDNQFMFNLKAGNGEIILTSERYTTKAAAENGIESVKQNSPNDERYARLESSAKQPYFTLKAANGQVIGTSEMYSSTAARETGISSVKSNGPSSPTDDQT
jgi:hypothetical protein